MYAVTDLNKLSDEEIIDLGYTEKMIKEIRDRAYTTENLDSLSDEEMRDLGFTQEEIDQLRANPKVEDE